jgi:hypothetical protein
MNVTEAVDLLPPKLYIVSGDGGSKDQCRETVRRLLFLPGFSALQ